MAGVTRFLVVDDSPPIRLMLRAAIERLGIPGTTVVEASSPEEAMKACEAGSFDLVFLDMVMGTDPGPTAGLLLLGQLLDRDPAMRIVLMTSLAPEHPDVITAIGLGAFAHLRKPVRIDAIKNLLQDIDAESGTMQRIR